MMIVRSDGIEACENLYGAARWQLQFTHHHRCTKAGQQSRTLCVDTFIRNSLLLHGRLWLQQACGCAVTLQDEDRQTVQQCWDVQRRLALG